MSDTNVKQTVEEQMAKLESSSDEMIPASEVKKLMGSVRALFEGDFNSADVELYGELGELAHYINDAKKQLRDFNPQGVADKSIPDASQQLDAIVSQTEQATSRIMDACEGLQGLHERIKDRLIAHEPPLDEDVLAGVDDAMLEGQTNITQIFESCNFQDLTGQRIMKIVNLLQDIERQVLRMIVIFGLKDKGDNMDESTKRTLEEEAQLLEGPQLPGNSLEQDDIDDILNALL